MTKRQWLGVILLLLGIPLLFMLLSRILGGNARHPLAVTLAETRHPSDKLHKELSQAEVDQIYPLVTRRNDVQSDFAKEMHGESMKFLFTANAGAAAGLFAMHDKGKLVGLILFAFGTFLYGVLSVGISHFALSSWADEMSRGTTDDINAWGANNLRLCDMDANNRVRFKSWKRELVRWAKATSFIALLVGAIIAAIPMVRGH